LEFRPIRPPRSPGPVEQPRSTAIATIRIFTEDDVPGAAALFARVHPDYRWSSRAACESYLREMLFDNPWRDLELPSWVAEEDGRISGFYGVVPRRMLLRERPLRGAAALRGRLDPRYVQELSHRHCWSRWDGPWTLVHSRHADVMAAIEQGDAFLSRLEGGWWLHF